MDNIVRVTVLDGINNRPNSVSSFFFAVELLLKDSVEKLQSSRYSFAKTAYLSSCHEFHHQCVEFLVFEHLVQLDDVGVIYLC